jgi:hypothetical protein
MTIEDLKKAAAQLPPRELNEFSTWVIGLRAELRKSGVGESAHGSALPHPPAFDEASFEADMAALAEGTEHVAPYNGSYSRDDIYLDHN